MGITISTAALPVVQQVNNNNTTKQTGAFVPLKQKNK